MEQEYRWEIHDYANRICFFTSWEHNGEYEEHRICIPLDMWKQIRDYDTGCGWYSVDFKTQKLIASDCAGKMRETEIAFSSTPVIPVGDGIGYIEKLTP